MEPRILTNIAGSGVATLMLNHPERNNAFDDDMIKQMIAHLHLFMGNDAVKIILISAFGKHFSAGADLGWMKRMAAASFADNRIDAAQLATLMNTLWLCTKPVIARVQGAAFGGAVGLLACADIVIAADDARFCLSEVKLGLAPAVISPYVTRAMTGRQASRYFLTAEEFTAAQARDMGLVHEVVTARLLDDTVLQFCQRLLKNGPHALRATKMLLRSIQPAVDQQTIQYTTDLIAALRVSAEGQEGLTAFFEKRAPRWTEPEGQSS